MRTVDRDDAQPLGRPLPRPEPKVEQKEPTWRTCENSADHETDGTNIRLKPEVAFDISLYTFWTFPFGAEDTCGS